MKTRKEKEEEKQAELERVQTLTNSYLMVDNDKINGVIDRYYNWTDYNKFSRPTEDQDVGSGMIMGAGSGSTALPNPISGIRIMLPDGNSTTTALGWAATGEQNSGWVRNGADDYSYLVNGTSVTEWLASEFRVNYLTAGSVLFAGTSGKVNQDNSNFFWDDSNNRLGIGCTDPFRSLEIRHASLPQLVLASDADNAVIFQGSGTGLVVNGYSTQAHGEIDFYNFRGAATADIVELSVYNTATSGASSAKLMAQVDSGSSGDAYFQAYNGTTYWTHGLDNSDSDAYVWSQNAALGTTNRMRLDTSGNLFLPIYTAGSVLYIGTSGQVSQNNAAFFWDNANTRLTVKYAWIYTPGAAASANLFVGELAGNLTLSSGNNTGIGWSTLVALTSADSCTAVGEGAGMAITTGIRNTALGATALRTCTDGQKNTAVGVDSMYDTTSGSFNTAVGVDSLPNNTTGNYNSALGLNALYNNTEGLNNVAMGVAALEDNLTGDFNVGVGCDALNNTLADNNVGIGYLAGVTNTSGSNNTYIGKSADASANNLSNATAIGSGASVSASNSMAFGDGSVTLVRPGGDNVADLGSSSFKWKSFRYGTQILAPDGTVGAPSISFANDTDTGIYKRGNSVLTFGVDNTQVMELDATALYLGSSGDAAIQRIAANVMGVKLGSSAQELRVYGSATLYAALAHDGSNVNLSSSSGDINMVTPGFGGAWAFKATTGHLLAGGDGLQNIGATGATRPKDIFIKGDYYSEDANGQQLKISKVTELTTIAAAATTDTAIQIPANAVVFAVSVRVTVAIPTAATFTVTGTTSGTQFDVAGGVSTAANTTDVGTRNCPYKNGAAQTIRITPDLTPAANTGRVRVTIHYYTITAPTS